MQCSLTRRHALSSRNPSQEHCWLHCLHLLLLLLLLLHHANLLLLLFLSLIQSARRDGGMHTALCRNNPPSVTVFQQACVDTFDASIVSKFNGCVTGVTTVRTLLPPIRERGFATLLLNTTHAVTKPRACRQFQVGTGSSAHFRGQDSNMMTKLGTKLVQAIQ